jgi:hypothetical protein
VDGGALAVGMGGETDVDCEFERMITLLLCQLVCSSRSSCATYRVRS